MSDNSSPILASRRREGQTLPDPDPGPGPTLGRCVPPPRRDRIQAEPVMATTDDNAAPLAGDLREIEGSLATA